MVFTCTSLYVLFACNETDLALHSHFILSIVQSLLYLLNIINSHMESCFPVE